MAVLPSVTTTVAYVAANDCARVGDLIKSTRDKFERRILGGDENVYIPVIPPFRNVAFFVKPVSARRRLEARLGRSPLGVARNWR